MKVVFDINNLSELITYNVKMLIKQQVLLSFVHFLLCFLADVILHIIQIPSKLVELYNGCKGLQ